MFRRTESDVPAEVAKPVQRVEPQPRRENGVVAASVIGASLHIKGEIDGAEDLIIEGIVEGTVALMHNTVTVGESGRVYADINANVIFVKGQIEGNLLGGEQVIVHRSGVVKGNICAPRVSLEDGAKIKGTIDTDLDKVPVVKVAEQSVAPSGPYSSLDKRPDRKQSNSEGVALQ